MIIRRNFNKGLAVLVLIEEALSASSIEGDYFVDCYQNCREQGFCVRRFDASYPQGHPREYQHPSVTFSENRNSDAVVVYRDSASNQGIDELSYQSRQLYQTIEEAADACVEHLRFSGVQTYSYEFKDLRSKSPT